MGEVPEAGCLPSVSLVHHHLAQEGRSYEESVVSWKGLDGGKYNLLGSAMKGKVIQGKGFGVRQWCSQLELFLFILEVYLYKCTKMMLIQMFIKASFVIVNRIVVVVVQLALEQLTQCPTTTEPTPCNLKPTHLESKLHHKRSHRNENPTQK